MKILSKILILFALALPLGAETLPVVTLDEAIEAASENNISLKQAAISLSQTIRNENNYVKDYLPSFGISASAGTGVSFPSATTDKTEFDGFNLNLGAALSFSYTLSGSKITGAESRSLSKESASLTYESTYDSIETLITSSYWTLATYDIAIENAAASLSDAKKNYDSTVEMYDSGLVDELTMSNMELSLYDAQIALTEAENAKALALESFKAATGITENFKTEDLPETVLLSLPPAEELFSKYSEGTTSIRSARNALSTALNTAKNMTLTQYMPTVTAEVGYTYAGNIASKNSAIAKPGTYATATNDLTGSISVNIPLSSYIPGSQADALRKDANDGVQIASLSLQNEQNTLLDSIRTSVITINQQQSSLEMLTSNLTIAEKSYSLAEDSYEAGLITANELSTSRTAVLTAKNNLLSARLSHLLSSYSLANSLGIELQELQDTYPLTEKETI